MSSRGNPNSEMAAPFLVEAVQVLGGRTTPAGHRPCHTMQLGRPFAADEIRTGELGLPGFGVMIFGANY